MCRKRYRVDLQQAVKYVFVYGIIAKGFRDTAKYLAVSPFGGIGKSYSDITQFFRNIAKYCHTGMNDISNYMPISYAVKKYSAGQT